MPDWISACTEVASGNRSVSLTVGVQLCNYGWLEMLTNWKRPDVQMRCCGMHRFDGALFKNRGSPSKKRNNLTVVPLRWDF